MIEEKKLQKRAVGYAKAVVFALTSDGPRPTSWAEVKKLVEAAYFNGFQSGVCWQKGEVENQVTKYRIVNKAGEVVISNIETEKAANRHRDRLTRKFDASHHVIPYKTTKKTMVRIVAQKR
jgi:hypothetical protein